MSTAHPISPSGDDAIFSKTFSDLITAINAMEHFLLPPITPTDCLKFGPIESPLLAGNRMALSHLETRPRCPIANLDTPLDHLTSLCRMANEVHDRALDSLDPGTLKIYLAGKGAISLRLLITKLHASVAERNKLSEKLNAALDKRINPLISPRIDELRKAISGEMADGIGKFRQEVEESRDQYHDAQEGGGDDDKEVMQYLLKKGREWIGKNGDDTQFDSELRAKVKDLENRLDQAITNTSIPSTPSQTMTTDTTSHIAGLEARIQTLEVYTTIHTPESKRECDARYTDVDPIWKKR
jgi:BMFP domain-containing protein YqiC